MTKTLTRHGNSYALVIDKPIMEMLHITPETPLQLATNGDSLVISPVRDKARQKKLDATLAKINRKLANFCQSSPAILPISDPLPCTTSSCDRGRTKFSL